ncbi:MAG TPA: HNH endonuclease [Burkholderiales bacterium]
MADKSKIEWTDAIKRRFWTYVQKSPGCWLWTGGTFNGRYGQFRLGAKKVRAHRAAWWLAGKTIPIGKILCHRCDNVKCVRPSHLFVGTDADNARDRDSKGRTSHLPTTRLPGALNPAARIAPHQVSEIRLRQSLGESQRALARAFGISPSQVGNIVRGKSWR